MKMVSTRGIGSGVPVVPQSWKLVLHHGGRQRGRMSCGWLCVHVVYVYVLGGFS